MFLYMIHIIDLKIYGEKKDISKFYSKINKNINKLKIYLINFKIQIITPRLVKKTYSPILKPNYQAQMKKINM